jgi:glucokinase
MVANAINLGWTSVPLKDEITQRLTHPLPLVIQKDANASALGEYYFGSVRGCDDFVFISIGSGLGAGVITGGRLVTGASWSAADLGHWSLDPNGRLCRCGQHGCAETMISGPGLIAVTRDALKTRRYPSSLIGEESLTTAQILAAATDGDPLAQAAFAQVGYHLGMVLAPCIALLNPASVVIGGGLGLASFDFLVGATWEALEQRVLPENRQELQIKASTQMSSAVGAASLVWYYQPV